MDYFNGAIFGSGQGPIAWRFWSTKTLDGTDQSPSRWSMVLLWFGVLGVRLSTTDSLSHEALRIRRQFIQSWLVRFCDFTWPWISWLENFHEINCNYFGCDRLYSRYWSTQYESYSMTCHVTWRVINDDVIVSDVWSSRKPVFWFARNLAVGHFWHFYWILLSYWLIMVTFSTMVSVSVFSWLLYV